MTERLDHWAEYFPRRVFLAARIENGAWRRIDYRDFRMCARSVAGALLQRGLSPTRPIAILSGNDIEHALLALGAMDAGIPYAPISPAYSLRGRDFTKLKHILNLLGPQLIFAANGHLFRRAIEACVEAQTELVVTSDPIDTKPAALFSDLTGIGAADAVDRAHDLVHAGTIAKILFTSGSTGMPKGVMNTQRMLTSNQEMLRCSIPRVAQEPPVLCDWLPWHHTFGGNHNFGLALYNGGTLYIDQGKPAAEAIQETVRNLMDVAPTIYFNVPKGFEMLASVLRAEPKLRQRFFSRLQGLFCAAASLSQTVWDELDSLSTETCGHRIPIMTGFGATETGPLALFAGGEFNLPGIIGAPVPGVEIKLAPTGAKLELRVRGPNVTPGFWGDAQLSREAFDEEGFYRTGDAVTLLDPASTSPVLLFDGRISHDFKLSTGTWVSAGTLRSQLMRHCGSLIQDAVIVGEGRDELTALLFVDREASLQAEFQACLEARLKSFAVQSTGCSNRIVRTAIVTESLSFEAGELTEKGTLNQHAVLKNRAKLVHDLYARPASPHILRLLESA